MLTQRITPAFGALLLLFTFTVHAAPLDIKTGLWEVSSKTDMSGSPIPAEVLAQMPPDRREQMMAMFKNRKAATHTIQTCITKDDLGRPFKAQDEEASCKSTIVTATPTKAEYKIQCSGSEAHSGVMKIETLSRESIRGSTIMQVNSGKATVANEMSGRWVAANCGNVK